MIGLLFDMLCAGFIASSVFVLVQFKTGFLVNRSIRFFGHQLRVSGEKGTYVQYSLEKEQK